MIVLTMVAYSNLSSFKVEGLGQSTEHLAHFEHGAGKLYKAHGDEINEINMYVVQTLAHCRFYAQRSLLVDAGYIWI